MFLDFDRKRELEQRDLVEIMVTSRVARHAPRRNTPLTPLLLAGGRDAKEFPYVPWAISNTRALFQFCNPTKETAFSSAIAFLLCLKHAAIQTIARDQIVVSTFLNKRAIIKNVYPVGIRYSRKPVSNDDRRAP